MSNKLLLSLLAAAFSFTMAGCKSVDLNEYNEGDLGGAGSEGTQVQTIDTEGVNTQAGPNEEVQRVLYFDLDSYVVKDEYYPIVAANAQYLRNNANARVVLEGNTDERGSTEYNLALGQKRAESVRRALLLMGVAEEQIEAVSYGKERPAAQGYGEEVWSQNRRVEFSYR